MNGCGKSSLTGSLKAERTDLGIIVDPDKITAELGGDEYEGGKLAVERLEQALADGVSFTQETTLSGGYTRKLARRAREQGYYIRLYYIGLDTVQESLQRIQNRVRKGGHDAGLGVVGLIRHSGIVVPPGVEVGLHILGGVAAGDAVLALLTSPDGLRPAVLQRLLGLLDVPAQNHVGLATEVEDLDLSRLLDILLHVVPPFGLAMLRTAEPP